VTERALSFCPEQGAAWRPPYAAWKLQSSLSSVRDYQLAGPNFKTSFQPPGRISIIRCSFPWARLRTSV